VLVIAARLDRLEPVTAYMREHFQQTVTWTRVNTGSFAAWRCDRAVVADGSRSAAPADAGGQP
jgi:hypothetical protein